MKVDVSTKIYLMKLNEFEVFKIMDIDDRHLFIQESYLEFVQAKVKEHKDKFRKPLEQAFLGAPSEMKDGKDVSEM